MISTPATRCAIDADPKLGHNFYSPAYRPDGDDISLDVEALKAGGEQDDAVQAATAPDPKAEGDEKPKPESEVRSQ